MQNNPEKTSILARYSSRFFLPSLIVIFSHIRFCIDFAMHKQFGQEDSYFQNNHAGILDIFETLCNILHEVQL